MKKVLILFGFLAPFILKGQDNCQAFLYQGDTCRYEACDYLANARGYFQLRRQYHEIKDKAIEICPNYSTPYKHKSTAFLKTGDFVTWKKLMDKAVELNPRANLDYRGWCRFQFFRDYEGAIEDFDLLATYLGDDIGYSQNGFYHLDFAKALCLKMLGKRQDAIALMEKRLSAKGYNPGLYDYLHLGVLYLETEAFDKAEAALNRQSEINELAENLFYKAKLAEVRGEKEVKVRLLKKAVELYKNSSVMYDQYTHQVDKVFLSEIEAALKLDSKK